MNKNGIKPDHQLPTHSWHVFLLCFSPTQNLLAVAARDKQGVTLVDTNTWTIIRKLPDFTWPPSSLQFSPDGRTHVAAEGPYHAAFCWNVLDGAVKWSLPKKTCPAYFSPDGSTLVVGKSKSVLLLDPATGKTRQQLDGHDASVQITAFTPDGQRVLSTGRSQAWLWNPKTAKPVRLLQEKLGQILNFAFSSTGLIALATQKGGVVRFYDTLSGEPQPGEIIAHESGTFYVDFTPDGQFLVTTGIGPVVRIWDVATRRLVRTLEFHVNVNCPFYKLSPDGKMIVVSLGFPVHAAHLYDLKTGSLLAVLAVEGLIDPKALLKVDASPQKAAFSPGADWLAIACDDGNTRVWSLKRVLR